MRIEKAKVGKAISIIVGVLRAAKVTKGEIQLGVEEYIFWS